MPDRILKESICTSDTLNQLSDFEERFWTRLLVNCDDFGRFDARPAILKGRLFPLADGKTLKNMTDALTRLASVGLVFLYEVDGRPFLQVVTWERYQRIRAKRSKYPPPDSACCQMTADAVKCPRNPIQSESNPNSNPCEIHAPTREQVEEFAKMRKSSVDVGKFFDYFEAANWRDSEGKPVFNWQQKLIAWEMREEEKQKREAGRPKKGPDSVTNEEAWRYV